MNKKDKVLNIVACRMIAVRKGLIGLTWEESWGVRVGWLKDAIEAVYFVLRRNKWGSGRDPLNYLLVDDSGGTLISVQNSCSQKQAIGVQIWLEFSS